MRFVISRHKSKNFYVFSAILLAVVGQSSSALAALRQVGPGRTYTTPCRAVAASVDGDVIEVDASGNYAGDVCTINKNNLTIRGVNGRPKIDANGRNAGGKGIWVVTGNNLTIENVEMSGARVPDLNGAAIRAEMSGSLTVRNSYFHGNENAILGPNNKTAELLIEGNEFSNNGAGDGYSHNLYLGGNRVVFRYNYSHDSNIGHLYKSRANINQILYSRFSTTEGRNPAYEIDVPNGGTTTIIGNIIHQPANVGQGTMISFAAEGATNPNQSLQIVNNTFVNDRSGGLYIRNSSTVTALVQNNIFSGTATLTSGPATLMTNLESANPGFVSRSGFDFRLVSGSAAIDRGSNPSAALVPNRHYVHPRSSVARPVAGALDIGAYEYGSTTNPPPPPPPQPSSSTIFGTRTPSVSAAQDTAGVEVGVKFRSTSAGRITAIRFYRSADNSAGFTVQLYSSNGSRLASATIPSGRVTSAGWVTVNLATPVSISANTTYVASYYSSGGRYAYTTSGLSSAVTNGSLTALASGSAGGNGVYRYGGSSGVMPTSSYNATNYFVDVVFQP